MTIFLQILIGIMFVAMTNFLIDKFTETKESARFWGGMSGIMLIAVIQSFGDFFGR